MRDIDVISFVSCSGTLIYIKKSILKKFEVVKFLTLLVNFENFEWLAEIRPLT